MNKETRNAIYAEAKEKWGVRSQAIAAAEEFSEAAAALCRHLNGKASDDKVVDELADVEIMAEQMRHYYSPKDIDYRKDVKLKALAHKLKPDQFNWWQVYEGRMPEGYIDVLAEREAIRAIVKKYLDKPATHSVPHTHPCVTCSLAFILSEIDKRDPTRNSDHPFAGVDHKS